MHDVPEKKIELEGFSLIEASAGTGKTYTIQNLYLRMVAGWLDGSTGVERHLRPDEILLMTYTIAATEELKERIRKILTRGVLYFENRSSLNEEELIRLEELLADARSLLQPGQTQEDRDRLIRNRIRNALLIFDDAAIFTIHGFCQRLLSRYAFESGILFNAEIRTDADQLIEELFADYLRAFSYPEGSALHNALKDKVVSNLSGYSQMTLIRELQSRPGLVIIGAPKRDPETLEREMEEVLKRLCMAYSPGMAAEMEYPEAGSADEILGRWKAGASAADTGETELDVLSKLHEHLLKTERLPERSSRFLELTGDLVRLHQDYQRVVPLHAACWTLERFNRMKQQENFLTFDDLLKNVLHAVRDPGNPLRELVRKQYRAAVVDEFQDTDPVQYEIFRLIFGQKETGHLLILVGDPKQAIYGFRGGDTATYRVAREFVKTHGKEYSLLRNFRSAEKLLNTVNDLFEKCPQNMPGGETVFADRNVEFHPVSAGRSGPGLLDQQGQEDPEPMKIRWLTVSDPDMSAAFSLKEMLEKVCRACAEDIVALLDSEWRSPETGKRLRPSEIAVLVPDNSDAKRMRDELRKRHVPCVIPKSENVFRSEAAKHLRTVLKAVESPASANLVSEAMLTPLLGFTLDNMIALHAAVQGTGNSGVLNGIQEKMRQLYLLWQQNSFLRMFQEMLRVFEVREKLLRRNNGERILTDLLHLRDLIQKKISETGLSPAGVLSFLTAQENEADSEEKETMMETDRSAVTITTIHSSKGLEYPVVMLPLMFKKASSYKSGQPACYHDGEGHLILNLAPDRDAVSWIERERRQELMRLLYVALTRAKYSCYLYWGLISSNAPNGLYDQTALDWLFPALSGHDWRNVTDFTPQLGKCGIRLIPADRIGCTQHQPGSELQEKLSCREWQGKIDPDYHFTSFTGLAGGSGGPDGLDYDSGDTGNRVENPVGIFRIPAGAQTGNAWHNIMEGIDFTTFDPEKNRDLIVHKMKIFGVLHQQMDPVIQEEYVTLTGQMIHHLLNTPLRNAEGDEFCLKDVSPNERLSELKFNYIFHQKLQTGQLVQALSEYAYSVFGLDPSRIAVRELFISGGFLNGAIDLLFRHNGKLYIADWKSNRISGRFSGFSADGVKAEMAEHTYYLQYLIYTVAVMKYLSLHLGHPATGEEYDRLFGGVYYFFMRGVDCSRPGQGIFFDRPPFTLIQKLDDLIG